MTPDYDAYGNEKYELALQYQDWVCDILLKECGIFVGQYSSRKYQFEKGESQAGYEIKHDMLMATTRNMFIEVAEKRKATNSIWVPSGIFREDNSWMYVIGDYNEIFIFSKQQLRRIISSEKLREKHHMEYKEIRRGTSQGYTYPIEVALQYDMCLKHIVINKGDKDNA